MFSVMPPLWHGFHAVSGAIFAVFYGWLEGDGDGGFA